MRRYGVFIPEGFAKKGLTGQFLPQHRNRKEWVRFLCALADNLNRIHLVLKNWPVMKYLKPESVSLCRTLNRVRL